MLRRLSAKQATARVSGRSVQISGHSAPQQRCRFHVGRWTAILALVSLAACGGGDPDDDHMPAPGLPDCAARPELCK